MPEVGGKKYDYTDAGIKAAAKAAKRTFPLVSAAIGGGRGASSAAKNMKRRKAKVEQATAAADKRTLDDLEDALTQEHNRGFTPGHSAAGRGSGGGGGGAPKKKVDYVPGDRLEMETYKRPEPPAAKKPDRPMAKGPKGSKGGGDEFANKFPQTAKDIARKSAGLAPEDQASAYATKVTRKEGPMDTGGLDSRDKTSFETPKKEFEPAWVGRERKRDRKARKRKKEKRDFADPGPDAAAEHIRNFRK